MVYQSENTLVLESKIQDGCRVLLNRSDLLQLQDLESAIYDIIERKSAIVKPIVLHHIELIATFLKINVPLQNSTPEIMRNRVRNIDNSYIQRHVIDDFFNKTIWIILKPGTEQRSGTFIHHSLTLLFNLFIYTIVIWCKNEGYDKKNVCQLKV